MERNEIEKNCVNVKTETEQELRRRKTVTCWIFSKRVRVKFVTTKDKCTW